MSMNMSDLELLLRITHTAVKDDILARQAGRRHYYIRGLFHYQGRDRTVMTLDESLTIENAGASNGKA